MSVKRSLFTGVAVLALILQPITPLTPSPAVAQTQIPGQPQAVGVAPLSSAMHVLPPLGESSGEASAFDQTLLDYLKVAVCEVMGGGDCAVVREFTAQPDGSGSDIIELQNHYYHVDWKPTKGDKGKDFEIHFAVAGLEVGFVSYTLDKNGTIPIKFRIDNHPRIRARVLHEQGWSPVDIAGVVQAEFNLSHFDLARILHDEFSAEFPEVKELQTEIAKALRAVGFDAVQVYETLKEVFDITDPDGGEIDALEKILMDAGFSEEEAFSAIQRELLAIYNQLIQQYGPVVYLHPDEKYAMSSVDWFMEEIMLVAGRKKDCPKDPSSNEYCEPGQVFYIEEKLRLHSQDGEVSPSSLMDVVYEAREEFGEDIRFWFDLPESRRPGNLESARSYVHVVRQKEFTDLQFWFFYPYNGPGTMSIQATLKFMASEWSWTDGNDAGWSYPGDFGNSRPLGEHTGDWEAVILRFDKQESLQGAFMSQHGDYYYFPVPQTQAEEPALEIENGHVVVYSSLNGHANFPHEGRNAKVETEDGKAVFPFRGSGALYLKILPESLNWTAKGDKKFEASKAYEIVAIDKWLLHPPPSAPPPAVEIPPLTSAFHVLSPLGEGAGEVSTFDRTLTDYLKVTVCEVMGGGDCTLVREFTAQPDGSGLDTIELQNQQYHVNWKPGQGDVGKNFEIHFAVAGLEVGFVSYTLDKAGTLPIKFRIDSHPWIRYRVLHEQGQSIAEIAGALQAEFALSHVDLAWILQAEGFSAEESAVRLREIGYDAEEIYEALRSVFDIAPGDAIPILVGAGFTERQAWYAVALDTVVDSSWMEFDGRWGWEFDLNLSRDDKVEIVWRIFNPGTVGIYQDIPEICATVAAFACSTVLCAWALALSFFYPAAYPTCFGVCTAASTGACTIAMLEEFDSLFNGFAPDIIDENFKDRTSIGPTTPTTKGKEWWYFAKPDYDEEPFIDITGLSQGQFVTGIANVQVEVSPQLIQAAKVELSIDGTYMDITNNSAGNNGYPYAWDTTAYEDGTHELHARVFDADGTMYEYYWDYLKVTVANNTLFLNPLVVDSHTITETGTVALNGTFHGPSSGAHTAVIDWDDGSQDTIPLEAGRPDFDGTHQYLDDNPSGTGSDLYTIQVTVSDGEGRSGSARAQVEINNLAPEMGPITASADLVAKGTPVTFTATFSDVGPLDTHTVVWDWGKGDTTEPINATSPVEASHEYVEPGVYEMKVIVADDDGGSVESTIQHLGVYDPSEDSYAAGAGRILAPLVDPECEPDPCNPDQNQCMTQEEASFHFVYDASDFELVFKLSDMVLHSSSAASATITDTSVVIEGSGTINGASAPNGEPYSFKIRATDGQTDTFRIQIWVESDVEVGTAFVWDADTGDLKLGITHKAPIHSAVFSPDGQRIVTTSDDYLAQVWDATPDNGCVSVVCDPSLVLTHTVAINAAAFSPDGQRIVTASDDGKARVWDASTGAELLQLTGHTGPVNAAAFSPDGQRIVTASGDGKARVWLAQTGVLTRTLNVGAAVNSAAFSPDGQRIVTASDDGKARVWLAQTGALTRTLDAGAAVNSAAFSPDGQRIVTASGDGKAQVWDASNGAELLQLTGHTGPVNSAAFSPDGQRIVTAGDDGTVRVWDAGTGNELRIWDHEAPVAQAAWNVDGSRILTAHPSIPQGGAFETDPDQAILGGEIVVHGDLSATGLASNPSLANDDAFGKGYLPLIIKNQQ